ncbi:hypothetical protein NQ315_014822 [Exocentrus adspersus]|uniref:Uncharacterized protein n=1 Tax=Exocentrus adspersus TaxID=1586481 RepID=A0AAV8VMT7_9CUCU|nr:hypothetical protein NQ315_014822 [Exocentrus adspersus]
MPDLNSLVSKFWETEKVPEIYTEFTDDQEACEMLFLKLPLKLNMSDFNLGDSYSVAHKRFINLENRLCANPELKSQYKLFIDEYIDLVHLKIVDINDYNKNGGEVYFMAHHPVIREDKRTTKLRVVFDGSMKSKK